MLSKLLPNIIGITCQSFLPVVNNDPGHLIILSSDWLGKMGQASKFENNQYEYQTTRAMAHIHPKKHVNYLLEGLIHLF